VHLVVDGYSKDRKKLSDVDLIRNFLDEYPEMLCMKKMIPPQVFTYSGETSADWGVSGFVLIAESHISVHTFPDRGYVNIDVFSCREFDAEASRREIEDTFGLDGAKIWVLERGIDYSTPREAHDGMVSERAQLSSTGGQIV